MALHKYEEAPILKVFLPSLFFFLMYMKRLSLNSKYPINPLLLSLLTMTEIQPFNNRIASNKHLLLIPS